MCCLKVKDKLDRPVRSFRRLCVETYFSEPVGTEYVHIGYLYESNQAIQTNKLQMT